MPAEANKALVRRLLEKLRGDWSADVIEEFYAPDYRRYLNPTTPPLTAAVVGVIVNLAILSFVLDNMLSLFRG